MTFADLQTGLARVRNAVDALVRDVAAMERDGGSHAFSTSEVPEGPAGAPEASGSPPGRRDEWALPAGVARTVEDLAAELDMTPGAVLVVGVRLVLDATRRASTPRVVLVGEHEALAERDGR